MLNVEVELRFRKSGILHAMSKNQNGKMRVVFIYHLLIFVCLLTANNLYGGNPDRQGEAGASELLFNPWARSAGLHSMSTSSVMGVEAMRLNIAGLARVPGTELLIANTRLFEGTDIQLNALGFAKKMGENSAFGITLNSVNFGDIPITTTAQPEGTGGFFSPNFFNIGLGYSYMYANKISVGFLVRGVSESLTNVSAFGIAIDAGVQYVTGEQDNFKLGISLRNIGAPMKFGGEGLSYEVDGPNTSAEYKITFESRSESFELPSVLNIGVSYDFIPTEDITIRALGNFTANSFSRDDIGGGIEFFFKDFVVLRAAYKTQMNQSTRFERNVYTGFAGGFSLYLPIKKLNNRKIGVDYAYRATDPFKGTHNFSIRLNL